MRKVNPFTPSAGVEPPSLIGRDDVLYDFEESLLAGVGSPARLMRITGPRGSGKTVLLNELGEIARKHSWKVVDETVHQAWVEDLCRRLTKEDRIDASFEVDLKLIHASVKKSSDGQTLDIRDALDSVVTPLTKKGKGLLVTIDEVQNASKEDVNRIAVAVQHLIREKKNIAFAFAGITSGVNSLLAEGGPTFLRRAYLEELKEIPIDEVAASLGETIRQNGLEIRETELMRAAEATAGYAYLVQLVGYNVWRTAARRNEGSVVSPEDVETGISNAMAEYDRAVLEIAIAGIGKMALRYLLAMAEDRRVSSTSDIARRLGVASTSLSSARSQLIERQIIEPTAYGYVAFAIPFVREYLRKNRAQLLARFGIEESSPVP